MTRPYFTIGHSTRSIEDFIALLKEAGVTMLADIRSIPRSRYNKQFNDEGLHGALEKSAIAYRHIQILGGLRGDYTAYMQTPGFRNGIAALAALHETHTVAFMCAEAKWQDCHRRYVADYLVATGNDVRHIVAPGQIDEAQPNPHAVLQPDGMLIYQPEDLPLGF